MNLRRVLLLLILAGFSFASAQVMNVRKWRKSEKDSLDNAMYLIDEVQYLEALPIFDQLLKNHPNEEFLRYTYAKCALYRSDKHQDAYNYLTELFEKNKKVPDIQYDVALASHYNYKFDEATNYINIYLANKKLEPEQRRNAEMLQVYVNNARRYYNSPTGAKLKLLGPEINSEADEYAPAVNADESRMVFAYAGSKSVGGLQNMYLQPDPYGKYLEDLYMSVKENGNWKPAQGLENLNSNAPEAPVSLSNDGSALFVYKDIGDGHGDLFLSQLNGNTYSEPVKLKGEINSYSWDGHCSLSPDGRTIYFSSERGGGFGGKDLYRATLLPDSMWGNVVNLGDSINTPYDEDAPYIHPDGRSLYYSSRGPASMGGYDVFRSIMSLPDSVFRKGENLGYPINSASDDIYFVVSGDNKRGYYSSARKDGMGLSDIYLVENNFETPLPAYMLVKGKTTDKTKPVEAEMKVEITSAGNKIYKTFRSNRITGDYLVSLPAGAAYKIVYTFPGKDNIGYNADATALSGYAERVNNVDFTIPPPPEVLAASIKTMAPTSTVTAVKSPTVKPAVTPSVAAVTKTTTPAVTKTVASVPEPTQAAVATATIAATTATLAEVKTVSVLREPGFPANPIQEKTLKFVEMYGKQTAPELIFRVQIAAVKTDHNKVFPNQKKLEPIEKVDLGDGFIRITTGGAFENLASAFEQNRKLVKAGVPEGFVIAIYQGKKVSLDFLVEKGLLK